MRLVYADTQKEVQVGDEVTDFRGDKCTVLSFKKPHKAASSGHVELRDDLGQEREYYVTVIGAEWIEREDR